jgi:hypothetical protein
MVVTAAIHVKGTSRVRVWTTTSVSVFQTVVGRPARVDTDGAVTVMRSVTRSVVVTRVVIVLKPRDSVQYLQSVTVCVTTLTSRLVAVECRWVEAPLVVADRWVVVWDVVGRLVLVAVTLTV